ncbi:hypothetical protein [Deinococcus aquatilis]|uniref:hypothetical protein n=1 Tax=Deinococcus aquatilis TaxID=519440 RepID=UPI00047777E0|nr:hypothetical protein [Deinococcus aquatilis]
MNTKMILLAAALLSGPAVLAQTTITPGKSTQVAPETRPVGDIPDNQAFVRYSNAAGGYSLEVPEGWARTVKGSQVAFVSKLGSVEVSTAAGRTPLSASSVKANELAALAKTTGNLKTTAVNVVKLPAGAAIRASFTSTGAVNAVTGKAPALENELFVLNHAGQRVTVRFSAPLGSDNVDAWKQMSTSLRWR